MKVKTDMYNAITYLWLASKFIMIVALLDKKKKKIITFN